MRRQFRRFLSALNRCGNKADVSRLAKLRLNSGRLSGSKRYNGIQPKRINKRFQLSLQAYILLVHSFSLATPTLRSRYRLHCILKNGNERQLYCLRFLSISRQVDCARKNRQLSDLYVLIKPLIQQTIQYLVCSL